PLRALALHVAQPVLELREALRNGLVALLLDLVLLRLQVRLDLGQVLVPAVGVNARDDVRGEVDDLLQVLGSEVEQVPQARRDALEVPDVRDRSGQLDVAHAIATDLRPRDLDATALADDALEADALVLSAVALPVAGGAE